MTQAAMQQKCLVGHGSPPNGSWVSWHWHRRGDVIMRDGLRMELGGTSVGRASVLGLAGDARQGLSESEYDQMGWFLFGVETGVFV